MEPVLPSQAGTQGAFPVAETLAVSPPLSSAPPATRTEPAPGTTASAAVSPPARTAPRSDRIVVLGRTQAGKTIYLASLYFRLWQEKGEISVRAMAGRTHKACVETIETLRRGEWPASTTGSRYLDIEIRYNGRTRPLVSLDYPGEVFRRAFIDGAHTSDVDELLDHVDRAAGVIALVDPAVVAKGDLSQAMDDDYGMYKAVERIRSRPGGERIPVALVLTKADVRQELIRSHGGATAFVKRHYQPLIEAAPNMRVFLCSAVQEHGQSADGKVDPASRPQGVVGPLLFVLKQLESIDEHTEAEDRTRQAQAALRAFQDREHESRKRAVLFWTLGWMGFVLLFGIVGVVTWLLAHR